MAASAAVVTAANGGPSAQASGTLFKGITFFIKQRVPLRSVFVNNVRNNGGVVAVLETQADIKIDDRARKDPDTDAYAYTWIEECMREGSLVDKEPHSLSRGKAEVRAVGARAPGKTTRVPFNNQDDIFLWQWVREKGAHNNTLGNEIYKALEGVNSRHPWQSWRDRYARYVSHNPPPGVETMPSIIPKEPTNSAAPPLNARQDGQEKEAGIQRAGEPQVESSTAAEQVASATGQDTMAPAHGSAISLVTAPLSRRISGSPSPIQDGAASMQDVPSTTQDSPAKRQNTTALRQVATIDEQTFEGQPSSLKTPARTNQPMEMRDIRRNTEIIDQDRNIVHADGEEYTFPVEDQLWLCVEASSILTILEQAEEEDDVWEALAVTYRTFEEPAGPSGRLWKEAFNKFAQPAIRKSKRLSEGARSLPDTAINSLSPMSSRRAQQVRDYSDVSARRWSSPSSRVRQTQASPSPLSQKRPRDHMGEESDTPVQSTSVQKRARFEEPASTESAIQAGGKVPSANALSEISSALFRNGDASALGVETVDLSYHVDSDSEVQLPNGQSISIYQDERHMEEERENAPGSPSRKDRREANPEQRVKVFTGEAGVMFSLEPSEQDPFADSEFQEIPESDDDENPPDESGQVQLESSGQSSILLDRAPSPEMDHSDSTFVDALSEPPSSRQGPEDLFETARQKPTSVDGGNTPNESLGAAARDAVSQSDLMGMPLPESIDEGSSGDDSQSEFEEDDNVEVEGKPDGDQDDDEAGESDGEGACRSPSVEIEATDGLSIQQDLGQRDTVGDHVEVIDVDELRSSPPAFEERPHAANSDDGQENPRKLALEPGAGATTSPGSQTRPSTSQLLYQSRTSDLHSSLQSSAGNSAANSSARRVAPHKLLTNVPNSDYQDEPAKCLNDGNSPPLSHSSFTEPFARQLALLRNVDGGLSSQMPRSRFQRSHIALVDRLPADADIEKFLEQQGTLGREQPDVERALLATMLDISLCQNALLRMPPGGDTPDDLSGCWTEDDDEALESGDPDSLNSLNDFHGEVAVILRRVWLRKVKQGGFGDSS